VEGSAVGVGGWRKPEATVGVLLRRKEGSRRVSGGQGGPVPGV